MSDTIYDFTIKNSKNEETPLANYKGKVLLIVNTASRCGFTYQYEMLEKLYEKYSEKGFDIIDFPCNQFGQQAPEEIEEYKSFCQLNYKTKFQQFAKIEVNGQNEIPLYTWLKSKKGFAGFKKEHKLTQLIDDMFTKADPDYAKKPDIKWNFTKFLIGKDGKVVCRFEPTAELEDMEKPIENELNK